MADTLEGLEREVAKSRARLADTLDQLTRPETSEAVKRDLMDTVHRAKDEVLNRARDTGRQTAQGLADNLKQRAIANPLAVALIGAGVAWRLYKRPPVATLLIGAGIASLMMSGGSGRTTAAASGGSGRRLNRDPDGDPEQQGYVPGGVAGYGYPVEEEAPRPGLTERAGAVASDVAERAREVGEQARTVASEAAARVSEAARDAGERARETASAVATQVSDALAEATEQASEKVSRLSDTALNAAARVRTAAFEQTESGIAQSRSDASQMAHDAAVRAVDLFDRAQRNPVILGAVGLAAGLAIARSVRATDAGGRILDDTTDALSEGARRMATSVGSAVSRAADSAVSLADSARAAAVDLGGAARQSSDQVTGAVASAASATVGSVESGAFGAFGSAREAVSSASRGTIDAVRTSAGARHTAGRRSPRATLQAPELSRRVQNEVYELGRRYPLLLGAAGLAVGAALGGVFEPTGTENRLFGEASDQFKQRAREMAEEQYEQIADAASQIARNVLHQFDATGPEAGAAGEASPGLDGMVSARTEGPNERAAMEAQRQGLGPV